MMQFDEEPDFYCEDYSENEAPDRMSDVRVQLNNTEIESLTCNK